MDETGTTPEEHRRLGKALFNEVWTLLDGASKTPADDDRLLNMAHASRYHWGEGGTAANVARGEWQVSRVYAVLHRAEPAQYHAGRALSVCEQAGLGDWDLAFAHEALARAHAVAGDLAAARSEAERALAVPIADDEDRTLLLADLATVPGLERFW